MKIAVAGAGYVGLALSVLLAQEHRVVCFDIDADRVARLDSGLSTVHDVQIQDWLSSGHLDLAFTTDGHSAYQDADLIIVATPTDYDPQSQYFDTRSVSDVIEQAAASAPGTTVVIKSTIPVGFTASMAAQHPTTPVVFSPEFLREGHALHDNLYPTRIVVGSDDVGEARRFGILMRSLALTEVPMIEMSSSEAEAVKLFSNTYLAMRVAFFNELDSFALARQFDTKRLIEAVCKDPRIGTGYNNPSFGYGGYCLPKDTKQLLATYSGVPQALMSAIVASNERRMEWIAADIASRAPRTVGVHRLSMKAGSDNFRQSSILAVAQALLQRGITVEIFEPTLHQDSYAGMTVATDLEAFIGRCDLIITNRRSAELSRVEHKVYSRDVFGVN